MENTNLTEILRDWPYEPGRLNARFVEGPDDSTLIQVRVEMGILQIETTGRPDGLRPRGFDSLFSAIEADFGMSGAPTGATDPSRLDMSTCAALREEAALYSYRSLVLSVLDDYEGVLRDMDRNLHVGAFIATNAAVESDRVAAIEGQSQLVMMRARALATLAVQAGDMAAARAALDVGLDQIRSALRALGREATFETAQEVELLKGMRDMLVPKLPASQRQELRERLQDALASENFELAAILSNELRLMR